MPTAANLGDPREGSYPQGHVDRWKQMLADAQTDGERQQVIRNRAFLSEYAFHRVRAGSYVSCWHMNEHENHAMWRSYTRGTDAVAVATTYQRIRDCLPRHLFMGTVRYLDYRRDDLPSMNTLETLMHKDAYFSLEQEFRIVNPADTAMPHVATADKKRSLRRLTILRSKSTRPRSICRG